MQEFSAVSYFPHHLLESRQFCRHGYNTGVRPSFSRIFWPLPGFCGRTILERRFFAVAPSRTTATHCLESIISSFCRRWLLEF